MPVFLDVTWTWAVNNGELLSLIHHNVTVSVPMGIYYRSILICLDLTQFTYSNYVLCNSNRNTRVSYDLDLVEAKLGHYTFFHKCHILIYSFLLSNKSPHRTKKRTHPFRSSVGRQKYFLFPSPPFPSCRIPEAGAQPVTQRRKDQQFLPALGPLVSKHTVLLNQPAISLTTWHFLCCCWRF